MKKHLKKGRTNHNKKQPDVILDISSFTMSKIDEKPNSEESSHNAIDSYANMIPMR